MGGLAQRLEQLDNEAASLTAEVEAAKDAWLSTMDGHLEAKLKEVYKDLKEEKKQLLEDMRALEAKLPGSGERTPLLAYSNGTIFMEDPASQEIEKRTVANDTAIPSAHFYVESALVEFLADELHTGRVVIYEESRKTGKTTDSLAVCRRLRKRGIQVVYLDLGPVANKIALNRARDSDLIWRGILLKLGLTPDQGESCYDTFKSYLRRPTGPLVAFVFDDCDSLIKFSSVLGDWLVCVRALSQARLQESRLAGQMLVGTPRLKAAITDALDGDYWSKLAVAGAKSPARFVPAEIGELMLQLVEARGGQLNDPIEDWAYAIWSYTEGYKGLTGLCLRELDEGYLSTQTAYNLNNWEKTMQPALTRGLAVGIRTAYDRMLSSVDDSNPIMQAIVQDLLLTGRHEVADPDCLCSAEYDLLCDGVVRLVAAADHHWMEVSSPLLAAAMLNAALASMADWPQLPAPPTEPSARELGEYLLLHALSQFHGSRLQQENVKTADGQQILEWALQHEFSRGLHLVLGSAVLFHALRLKRAVEVRNIRYEASIASSSSPSMASDTLAGSQDSTSAGIAVSASSPGQEALSERNSGSDYAGATKDDMLRRLDIFVGNGPLSTGFELSSAGSAASLREHAERCAKYHEQHSCQVFAVNLQRPKRRVGRPRKVPLPPFKAETDEELQRAMQGFAKWPDKQPDKVIFVNVLIELELERVLVQYVDQPDVVKIVHLRQARDTLRVSRSAVQPAARMAEHSAGARHLVQQALGSRHRYMGQPCKGWFARTLRVPRLVGGPMLARMQRAFC
ncbi:hypothetical protein COCSUDRAFT_60700 [Coccomyxa subellipsoidea C-169]|uniref:Uncharacterized protein n=1 Tax=Coccomyxa subellipsoidea (strain C-169) TaxID=574566 RepID=I0Z4W6_COCSC|nr:hypothetical protein COCSUDRAFT_60700 [Coccomyxa subellipsoidea C-169]EIE25685.1 hypothetical protein COCSUDRAFT_60700 [Coccomyxa subellipsoidea C-169]|eukprot:XP_005650229.1 hypothetical protein COCSUDRAFT_60700 [Coccomyxa subellipsoidea C-169]